MCAGNFILLCMMKDTVYLRLFGAYTLRKHIFPVCNITNAMVKLSLLIFHWQIVNCIEHICSEIIDIEVCVITKKLIGQMIGVQSVIILSLEQLKISYRIFYV